MDENDLEECVDYEEEGVIHGSRPKKLERYCGKRLLDQLLNKEDVNCNSDNGQ